jgi:hypothetical protein
MAKDETVKGCSHHRHLWLSARKKNLFLARGKKSETFQISSTHVVQQNITFHVPKQASNSAEKNHFWTTDV